MVLINPSKYNLGICFYMGGGKVIWLILLDLSPLLEEVHNRNSNRVGNCMVETWTGTDEEATVCC